MQLPVSVSPRDAPNNGYTLFLASKRYETTRKCSWEGNKRSYNCYNDEVGHRYWEMVHISRQLSRLCGQPHGSPLRWRRKGAIAQGALPEEVDQAAKNFGMRMGPMAMADLVGLDLGIQAWKKAGTYNPSKVPTHALIEMGRKGQKSNAGWFDYKDNRTPVPSKKVTAMLRNMFPLKGGN